MLSRRGEYKVRQCLYWRAADIRASNEGSRRLHEVLQSPTESRHEIGMPAQRS